MSSRLRSTSKKDAKGKVKSSKNIKQKVSINTLEASSTAATSEAQTEQVRVHNQSIIHRSLPQVIVGNHVFYITEMFSRS